MREKLLIKLGRKAVVGSNQYTGDGITNTELASQLKLADGYSYKKQVNNLEQRSKNFWGDKVCREDDGYGETYKGTKKHTIRSRKLTCE